MRNELLFVLLQTLSVFGAPTGDAPLKEYANERYGFVLRYPAALSPGVERVDGSGREFHTADGKFKVFAFAEPLTGKPGQEVAQRFAQELRLFGQDVSYQKRGEHWFVVSGVGVNGTEFYSKAYAKNSAVTLFRITYPHAENKTYDAWVTRIEKNFIPSRAADASRENSPEAAVSRSTVPVTPPGKVAKANGPSAPDADQSSSLPTARPVPGKPGYVYSPSSSNRGYIDVTGYASGSKAKDPYSGKIFIVP